ncbi:hypothetical protein BDD12DRAFT_879012 [Trichophaea hybrida]|nr:hypothetical protein BDD12DRAFT_879012 [Trichophaea hybrida]
MFSSRNRSATAEHGHFQPYTESPPQRDYIQPYIDSLSESGDNLSPHHSSHPSPGSQSTTRAEVAIELPGDSSAPDANDMITILLSHASSFEDILLLLHLRNRLRQLEQAAAVDNARIQELQPDEQLVERLKSQITVDIDRINTLTSERDRLEQTELRLRGEIRRLKGYPTVAPPRFQSGPADDGNFQPDPLHEQILDDNQVLCQHRRRLEYLMRQQEVEHILERAPVEADVVMLRDQVKRLTEQRDGLARENEELREAGVALVREVEEKRGVIEELRRERRDIGGLIEGLYWMFRSGGDGGGNFEGGGGSRDVEFTVGRREFEGWVGCLEVS